MTDNQIREVNLKICNKCEEALLKKLEGLEEVIKESSLCHVSFCNVSECEKEVKELVTTVRQHILE